MLQCMKTFSGIGVFILLAVAFIMTCITLYGYSNSAIFLNDTDSRNTVLGILITADLLIIMGSLIGIYGIKKRKPILIFIYQIFVVIFIWVFLSLGIAVETLPSQYFDGDCTQATNPNVQIASVVSAVSDLSFCLKNCECGLTNDTLNTKYTPFQKNALNMIMFNKSSKGAKSLKQCANYAPFPDSYKNIVIILGELQNLLDCTGWCNLGQNNPFGWIYRFSDVNNGKPSGYCYDMLMQKTRTYSNVVGLGAISVAIFLLVVFLVNLYLCCHKDRKHLRFTQRFSYIPQGKYRRLV